MNTEVKKRKDVFDMLARSHTVLLAFAIVFVMGMALAVAILCIPMASNEAPNEQSTELDAPSSAPQSDTVSESETEPTPILPDVSNGLQFTSLGNGTCALTGIGVCIDACVVIPEYSPFGDRVTEIVPRALYGVSTVTAIQIPASVRVIGELAFAACENLTESARQEIMALSLNAKPEPFCPHWGDVKTELVNPLQTIFLKEGITREEAQKLLDDCANALYEKYPETFKK